MSNIISFFIPGKPEPKGRPRFTRNGRTYTPLKTQEWENTVALVAMKYKPIKLWTGPILCWLDFHMPKPLRHPKKRSIPHKVKPDLDNLCKSVLDAMENIIFKGDQQITSMTISKEYSDNDKIGVYVRLENLGDLK